METLKADFHIHTAEDPYDVIKWDARRIIEEGARHGFRVLALTNHISNCYSEELAEYAAERNIVLIPGCESQLNRRHVVLLNPTPEAMACRNFAELRRARRNARHMAVIAPHAFFPSPVSLWSWLYRYADIFDAIEWCSYYFKWLNFNRFAKQAARLLDLPMVGSSDTHYPWQFGKTYTMIEAEPTVEGVIESIHEGRCRIVTKPFKFNVFTIFLGLRGLGLAEKLLADSDEKLSRGVEQYESGVR